jgi:ABC-2 type transport system permease protein
MAVYERRFRRYTGPTTPRRWRFLVLADYARREVFRSRIATALFALAFAPCLAAAAYIYLRYNLGALTKLEIATDAIPAVDELFFSYGLRVQGALAFLLTALIGPGLVSPDLANNALPLYLSRPFSRADYVLGKLTVLVAVLSAVTWVPLVLLALLEASLAPGPWLADHARVFGAVVVGAGAWILLVALLALALSAWVRWKTLAAALLVAVFFVTRALSALVNGLFDTVWGDLLSPGELIRAAWDGLFFGAPRDTVPLTAAWVALAAVAGCCLLLLNRKLRAYEVVR